MSVDAPHNIPISPCLRFTYNVASCVSLLVDSKTNDSQNELTLRDINCNYLEYSAALKIDLFANNTCNYTLK